MTNLPQHVTGSKLGECDTDASQSNGFVRANSLLTHGTSVESRFSEARCAKSLPVAMATYKEGLPPHYLQVWSLSSLKVSRQVSANNLNQVSSVSLLMTSSTALANKGLFELTRRPLLTWAVLSFAETTEELTCKGQNFVLL